MKNTWTNIKKKTDEKQSQVSQHTSLKMSLVVLICLLDVSKLVLQFWLKGRLSKTHLTKTHKKENICLGIQNFAINNKTREHEKLFKDNTKIISKQCQMPK